MINQKSNLARIWQGLLKKEKGFMNFTSQTLLNHRLSSAILNEVRCRNTNTFLSRLKLIFTS